MKYQQIFIGLFLSFICYACEGDIIVEHILEEKGLSFVGTDFTYDESSRTTVEITDKAAVFSWAANDTIGIFPDLESSQVRFSMIDGAGTKTATFDGGGWALKAEASYASYYPYIPNIYLDKNNIPVDYTGQVQLGHNQTSHLGVYDYMVANAVVPNDGEATFEFRHLGCLVQLKVTVPVEGDYHSVILKAEDKIFVTKGAFDLMAKDVEIVPQVMSDSIVLGLKDVRISEANQELLAYLMMPPMDLSGKEIRVILQGENDSCLEGTLSIKKMVAGTAYALSVTIAQNEPEEPEEEGIINVTKAGTLENLLGDTKYKISQMAVKGNLNSDDIALLRRMSGGYRDTTDVDFGILKELDLSQASIVVGGSYYMNNGDKKYKITAPNTIGDCMFYGCSVLESLVLPNGITSIGEAGVSSCANLTEVTIPDGVTSIGVAAFNGCNSLAQIELPAELVMLGSDVFHSCYSLQSIEIPYKVEYIGSNSFGHCTSLTNVKLSEGLESIGTGAFGACTQLVNIDIPNTVRSIGQRAFAGCTALEQISLSGQQSTIESYTFENCSALKIVVIPEGVVSIAERAFQYCANIIDITLPSSLKNIGARAFYAISAKSPITVRCNAVTPPTLSDNVWVGGDNVAASKLYVESANVNSYKNSSWNLYFGEIIGI